METATFKQTATAPEISRASFIADLQGIATIEKSIYPYRLYRVTFKMVSINRIHFFSKMYGARITIIGNEATIFLSKIFKK